MTSRRITQFLTSSVLALVTALVTQQFVQAYQNYAKWPTNSSTYNYGSDLPSSFYASTDYGANLWTQVAQSSWTWTRTFTSQNLIRYGNIDGSGGTISLTSPVYSGTTLQQIQVKYDSSENWYTGSIGPGANQWDLYSAAAHEFGHSVGLCHPNDPSSACAGNTSPCSNNSGDPTMCLFPIGTSYARSLAGDDTSGLAFLYP